MYRHGLARVNRASKDNKGGRSKVDFSSGPGSRDFKGADNRDSNVGGSKASSGGDSRVDFSAVDNRVDFSGAVNKAAETVDVRVDLRQIDL